MEITFTNGAFVHRLYVAGVGMPELIGAFQYSDDAERFARAKLAEDASRDWRDSLYAVTDSRTAEMRLVRHEAAQS